jgi:hypothetical protein
MPEFSTLLLHASETFGAPAYLARILGQEPQEIYRWIAGIDTPAKAQCERLAARLRAALQERATSPALQRRWGDRATR